MDLDDLIKFNDTNFMTYSQDANHQQLIKRRFYNRYDTVNQFHVELEKFDFCDKDLVRPSFDTYFLRLAEVAASRSNCMKRGIGAVIVQDNRVISTGYNGTPFGLKNCNEGGCKRCNDNVSQGKNLD